MIRMYKKTVVLGILGLLIGQLNARTVYSIDLPKNQSDTISPQTKRSLESREIYKLKEVPRTPAEMAEILKNSEEYRLMDPQIKKWVDSNEKNYINDQGNSAILYYDKESGIEVEMAMSNPPIIFVHLAAVTRPEAMACDYTYTEPVHPKTKQPYFHLTGKQLKEYEAATGTTLTPDEKNWLRDLESVLNENIHYFYGEPFVNLAKVVPDKDRRLLIGTYLPPRMLATQELETFIPTQEMEAGRLWLHLADNVSKEKQKAIITYLMRLPKDEEAKKTLLADTDRWLTEFGTSEATKKAVDRLIPALAKASDSKTEKKLLKELYPLIDQSRYRLELFSRYIQSPKETARFLEQIQKYVKDKKIMAQTQADLERVDQIYANKLHFGQELGRPVYHHWQYVKRVTIGGTADCMDHGTMWVFLKDSKEQTIWMFNRAYPGPYNTGIHLNLAEKASQTYLCPYEINQMSEGLKKIAAEKGVDVENESANQTAFQRALYNINHQVQFVSDQLQQTTWFEEVNKKLRVPIADHEEGLSDCVSIQFEGMKQIPVQKHKDKSLNKQKQQRKQRQR